MLTVYSPLAPLKLLWLNRSLFWALVRREIQGRYKGTWLGMLWSIITPILSLGIYWFVFGLVLKVRWGSGLQEEQGFAIPLFCGIILFGLFSETLSRSPGLVIQNTNYVSKVVFPLPLLGWVTVAVAFFHFLLALAVLLISQYIVSGVIPMSILALPLLLAPFLLINLGVSWFLASLGTFVRDTTQIMGFISTALLFLSPVFFPLTAVPLPYRDFLSLNPMTYIIVEFRNVVVYGLWPDWSSLLVYALSAVAVFWLGHAWFEKTRTHFSDAL